MNKALIALTVAFALHNTAAHAVVFTTNTTIGVGIPTYDGQPIVVSNCTLTVNGPHSFASLLLTNSAVLTHSPAPNGETNNRVDLTIAGDVGIPADCRMDVSGRGYASASGPDAGCSNGSESGGGGGHGGVGGVSAKGCPGGGAYDSFLTPELHGSGGGNGYYSSGGYGGGVIRLTVGGTLRVDGAIAAHGANPTSGGYGGGGAGGSITLVVDTLAGNGTISANGGNGSNPGGGGGGGRIAVELTTLESPPTTTAFGGNGNQRGGAGTVLVRPSHSQMTNLDVWNGDIFGAVTPLSITGGVGNLVIRNGAIAVPGDALVVTNLSVGSNGVLTCLSGQAGLFVTVLNALSIQVGGRVTADGLGWPSGAGPGAGTVSSTGNGSGAGHGGQGGDSQHGVGLSAPGGGEYDSITDPVQWGSGGGNNGGAGGGRIQLTVGGTLLVKGTLTANGNPAYDAHLGGGSGGTLNLRVGQLAGSGVLSANGGASGGSGGGGGGGRVAIRFGANAFTGTLSALGFSGGTYGYPGGAGTVFTLTNGAARGQVRIDNGGLSGLTRLSPVYWPAGTFFDLTLAGATELRPAPAITVGNLLLTSGAIVRHDPGLSGFHITALGDATIETNCAFNADSLGYPAASGPGAGVSNGSQGGGGGGHGGRGGHGYAIGGAGGPGGPTNDSSAQPVLLGSGGGDGYLSSGGSGGGALRLTVYGTLQLDGAVRAIGAPGGGWAWGAGGAGGSLWIEAGGLRGSGLINAGGGSAENGGGGGGGRIAIYCADTNGFTGWIGAGAGLGGYPTGSGQTGYAGTVAWFPAIPPLLSATQQGSDLSLSWPSVTNVSYQLQSTPVLPPTTWNDEGAPLPGTGGPLSTNLLIGADPKKFFRLLLLGN